MAGSQTSWDADSRTFTVQLDATAGADVEDDLRSLPRVRGVDLQNDGTTLVVGLHSRQDANAVEDRLRVLGLLQPGRWRDSQ